MPGRTDNIRKNNRLKQYDYDFKAWNRSNENMGNRPSTKKSSPSRKDDYGGKSPGTVKTSKPKSTSLSERGYPSSTNPSSQPTVKKAKAGGGAPSPNQAVKRDAEPTTNRSSKADTIRQNAKLKSEGYETSGNPDSTRPTSQPTVKKPATSLSDRGYPSSTNPSSQPTKAYEEAFGKKNNGDWLKVNAGSARVGNKTETKKKGTWNAEEEMKKRREAAKAQGKGTWNAEEEMRKRREAAMAKKRGGK